jgi:hypothetical protein
MCVEPDPLDNSHAALDLDAAVDHALASLD